jgi:molybdenum cofactor cytidylyltransferase
MIAAVVPAAGRSERMGRPKMLLRPDGQSVIARVVTALLAGGAERLIVVAPPADSTEGPEIATESAKAGAEVIVPKERPATMRDSIELALAKLARGEPVERVVIAPGDTPGITSDLVERLLESACSWPESIIVPCCNGRRGHPVVVPWSIAELVPTLPPGVGVNALVERHRDRVVELAVPDPDLIADVNTPEVFEEWNQRRLPADGSGGERGSHRFTAEPRTTAKLRVTVRLFALARERAGRSEIELEVAPPFRVADLLAALSERVPAVAPLLPTVLIAVNEEYAELDAPIAPGSRVAVIPPVSGGQWEDGGASSSRSR